MATLFGGFEYFRVQAPTERNFLIDCNSAENEDMEAGMVIDYMTEYISTANSKISLKVRN